MVLSSSEVKEEQTAATSTEHRGKASVARYAKHMAGDKQQASNGWGVSRKASRHTQPGDVTESSGQSDRSEPSEHKEHAKSEDTPKEQNDIPQTSKDDPRDDKVIDDKAADGKAPKSEASDSAAKIITPKPDEKVQAPIPLATPKPISLPSPIAFAPANDVKAPKPSSPSPSQPSGSHAPVVTATSDEASKLHSVPSLSTKAQTSHVSQSPLATPASPVSSNDSYKESSYKENPYTENPYKENPYKENPYKELMQGKAPKTIKPKESRGHGKVVAGVLIGVFCVLAAVYVGFALFFEGTFMPNTLLNGRDVSLLSKEEAASVFHKELEDYTLQVDGAGLNFAINSQDVGLGFDSDSFINSAIEKTSPWLWPITIWSPRAIEGDQGTTFDEAKLQELVTAQVDEFNETAEPPTNASVAYDDASKQFQITPDSVGTQLDSNAVTEDLNKAFASLQHTASVGDDALLQPAVTKDDPLPAEAASKANSYLNATVTLKMNGQDAGSIDASKIKDWVKVGEDLVPILDEEAVAEWGRTELSGKLDTINRERTFTRADGKQITVNGGTYGWSIDSSALAPMISQAVSSGNAESVDVPVVQSAAHTPDEGGRDWGNRYIDVDLSEQYVRMYDDSNNVIWEAPCVSGDVSEGHTTPTGVYFIDEYFNKESPASVLVGYYPSGEKEYESPVSYWMPFIDNSVGLHDANWRGAFGSSINYYNGSHGCVNLPVSSAGELCQLVNQGDVVVVHY